MTSEFYMVASSLPRMPASFKIPETPISRLQLDKRLKLLPIELVTKLFKIELLVWSSWFMPKLTVLETRIIYVDILNIQSPFISNLVHWFLDLRSIIAAIRMRNEKKGPPQNTKDYWISSWDRKLIQKWDEPDFGLKSVYPWIPKLTDFLEKNDAASIEEFILTYIWKHLSGLEIGHYFDFEMIIIYLLRWDIVNYWSKFNKDKVMESINTLCDSLVAPMVKELK